MVAARRATVVAAQEFLGDLGSAFEEGFGYLLSADPAERDACLGKFAALDSAIGELLQRSDPSSGRQIPLQELRDATNIAMRDARKMFEDYESDHRVHDISYKAYEDAMDGASAKVRSLILSTQQWSQEDERTAHRRTNYVIFLIGTIATVLAGAHGCCIRSPIHATAHRLA